MRILFNIFLIILLLICFYFIDKQQRKINKLEIAISQLQESTHYEIQALILLIQRVDKLHRASDVPDSLYLYYGQGGIIAISKEKLKELKQ